MALPWVSRELLRSAEERIRWTEQQLREAEQKLAAKQGELEQQRNALIEIEAERRKLMDRMLRLSGQPPLYETAVPEPAFPAAVAANPDLKELAKANALPVAGTTFRGVHAAVREAMANGTFDISKARPRL